MANAAGRSSEPRASVLLLMLRLRTRGVGCITWIEFQASCRRERRLVAPSSGPPDGLDMSSTEPEEQFNILLAQVLVSPWNEANATW